MLKENNGRTQARTIPEVAFQVENHLTGAVFTARIVVPGQLRCGSVAAFGASAANTSGEALIEFYDARTDDCRDTAGNSLGTFIARLRMDALLSDMAIVTGRDSLDLHSFVAAWKLDLRGTGVLLDRLAELGYAAEQVAVAA